MTLVALEPCTTCKNEGVVEVWYMEDGSDYPDRRGRWGKREVPCPDCKRRIA